MLKGKAKAAYQREYMRRKRAGLTAEANPSVNVRPMNRYLAAHMKEYPEGFNLDGSYRLGYDPLLDPSINPLLRPACRLPNSPDGRYHEPI